MEYKFRQVSKKLSKKYHIPEEYVSSMVKVLLEEIPDATPERAEDELDAYLQIKMIKQR